MAVSVESGQTLAALDGDANVTGNVNVTSKQSTLAIEKKRLFVVPTYFTGVAATAVVGTAPAGNLLDDLKKDQTKKKTDQAKPRTAARWPS